MSAVEDGIGRVFASSNGNGRVHQDGRKILKDLVHYRTYARTLGSGRRETRSEVIDRVKEMHQDKFPALAEAIEGVFALVHSGHVVPSMRTMQFAGDPIVRSNARAYNCAYSALTTWKDFADLFWLLMNGVGTGFSVQRAHVGQLPVVHAKKQETFVIPDSKEGWADSILCLLQNPSTNFVYGLIRAKGATLSTGGTASGPESLRMVHDKVRAILRQAEGRKLEPIEAHDIMCHVADVVVVGGVRRAALISLFDPDDEAMLAAKHGDWWEDNPQRARANNSAVIHRFDPNFDEKLRLALDKCFQSGSGEPGIILTNDYDYGYNPCCEISLRDGALCNLSEVNVAACHDGMEFRRAVHAATVLGSLQATYTDFDYIAPRWRENCEAEALLGVSLTGQAQGWPLLALRDGGLLRDAAGLAVETNFDWASRLGINPAARVTTTKPSGTTSAWLGTTSGIHAAHSSYYLRRVRIDRKDEFGEFLINTYGEALPGSGSFIETDRFAPDNIVVTLPVMMEDAIKRQSESALDLLGRAKFVYGNWIKPGHQGGPNTHNVSLTVSYHPEEEREVADWMATNSDCWSGISLLPFDGGTYEQAPFQEVEREEFDRWMDEMPEVDFAAIRFKVAEEDEGLGEAACSANGCEIQ